MVIKLNKLIEIVKQVTEKQDGEHIPQFIFENKDRKLEMFLVPFDDNYQKDIFVQWLKLFVEAKGITTYYSVFGAWVAKRESELPENIRVSDLPETEKKEAVIISKYEKSVGTETIICAFRRENGVLIWEDEQSSVGSNESYSKFNVWQPYMVDLGDN